MTFNKIVHIADLHITDRHTLTPNAPFSVGNLINRIKSEVNDDDNVLVVVVGDIFHKHDRLTSKTVETVYELFTFLGTDYTVIIIPGNHDIREPDAYKGTLFDLIERICSNVTYVSTYSTISYDNVSLTHVPFWESSLTDEQRDGPVKRSDYNICLYHGTVYGALYDNGSKARCSVSTADFQKYDATMLGHFHRYQEVSKNIVYSGGVFQRTHGESSDKGFVVWDVPSNGTPMSHRFVKVPNGHQFVTITDELPVIPSYVSELSIRYSDGGEDAVEALGMQYDILERKRIAVIEDTGVMLHKEIHMVDDVVYLKKHLTSLNEEMSSRILTLHEDTSVAYNGESLSSPNWEITDMVFKNLFSYGQNTVHVVNYINGTVTHVSGVNGSGKSSIMHITMFALYGRGGNGSIISDILNKTCGTGYAKLTIKSGQNTWTISRTLSKTRTGKVSLSSLLSNGMEIYKRKAVVDREISKIAGSYKDFMLHSITSPSIGKQIHMYSKTDLANVLANIVDVGKYKEMLTDTRVLLRQERSRNTLLVSNVASLGEREKIANASLIKIAKVRSDIIKLEVSATEIANKLAVPSGVQFTDASKLKRFVNKYTSLLLKRIAKKTKSITHEERRLGAAVERDRHIDNVYAEIDELPEITDTYEVLKHKLKNVRETYMEYVAYTSAQDRLEVLAEEVFKLDGDVIDYTPEDIGRLIDRVEYNNMCTEQLELLKAGGIIRGGRSRAVFALRTTDDISDMIDVVNTTELTNNLNKMIQDGSNARGQFSRKLLEYFINNRETDEYNDISSTKKVLRSYAASLRRQQREGKLTTLDFVPSNDMKYVRKPITEYISNNEASNMVEDIQYEQSLGMSPVYKELVDEYDNLEMTLGPVPEAVTKKELDELEERMETLQKHRNLITLIEQLSSNTDMTDVIREQLDKDIHAQSVMNTRLNNVRNLYNKWSNKIMFVFNESNDIGPLPTKSNIESVLKIQTDAMDTIITGDYMKLTDDYRDINAELRSKHEMVHIYQKEYDSTNVCDEIIDARNELDESDTTVKALKIYIKILKPDKLPGDMTNVHLSHVDNMVNTLLNSLNTGLSIVMSTTTMRFIKNGINLPIGSASGYECFVVDMCVKLVLRRYTPLPVGNIIFVDEGLDCVDDANLVNLGHMFNSDTVQDIALILITHSDRFNALCSRTIHVTRGVDGYGTI